jgi:WD40 repeat protein
MIHHGPVLAAAFSPDGKFLATGCELLDVVHRPDGRWGTRPVLGQARLWRSDGQPAAFPIPHPAPVWSVALSRGGALLLTGSLDAGARLWHALSGKQIGRMLVHDGNVRQVVFSSDGRLALTASAGGDEIGGASARLWELPEGLDLGRDLQPPSGNVRNLVFSPDGKDLLAWHFVGKARLWDVESGNRVGPELTHAGKVEDAAFSPDGRTILTSGDDGMVRLWQRGTGRVLWSGRVGSKLLNVAFSPDGARFAVGGLDGVVRCISLAGGPGWGRC